ncbi:MAG: hypothetical protein H7293_16795 [Candidatus Saccharibacteria bacterium]|nr:hypothetical protein [Rhodoferax sp.]
MIAPLPVVDGPAAAACISPVVRHLRQILLWPLRLIADQKNPAMGLQPWQTLRDLPDSPWSEVHDEFSADGAKFEERHYNEFVTFLPYVQRFLYGEGRSAQARSADGLGTPMRVFRRHDVAQFRVQARPGDPIVLLDVQHIDLYFFLAVDLVFLNVEVSANDLTLPHAQELMYRFGRGYPAGWDAKGLPLHCLNCVELLHKNGQVLASSDAHDRMAFMQHVSEHRAPRITNHWAYLLRPLVSDHSVEAGPLRFRQIEYYRMPMMAYLGLDDPRALTRSDFIRLGLVTGANPDDRANETNLPYSEDHLADFERRFCYDRFWTRGGSAPNTRYLCSGHSLIVVGATDSSFYSCGERGVLAHFRHQHFLLFLIAHFQKAALLMYSDRLVEALKQLSIGDANSVRAFKRAIRGSFESFLGFTHRYWFHEVAEQAQARALFQMCANHLGLDPLYAEVKARMADMNTYLDTDSIRRQANTVVRLTVVTIFGLIGTVTTGFLGMNLLAEADAPWPRRLAIFVTVFSLTTLLTIYTMVKSRRLSDFLDNLSDDKLSAWQKTKSFFGVWGKEGGG